MRTLWRALLLFLPALGFSCGNGAPSILPIQEQQATVGVPLEFDVVAVDPDEDDLQFSLQNAPAGATITKVGPTEAKFRWVPTAAQTLVTSLDIVASDGRLQDTERVPVTVSAGEGSGPTFTSPTSYVIDLARSTTLRFDITVRDDNASTITFTEVVPIPRAQLKPKGTATTAKKATFTWAPDQTQRATPSWIYVVKATNEFGQSKEHRIAILIRGGGACSGPPSPPVIDVEEVGSVLTAEGDFLVAADISDNSSILEARVHWAYGENPTPATFTAVDLVEEGGRWIGAIPRPPLQPGESRTITWQVCALDDDDDTTHSPTGNDPCDNLACTTPASFVAASGGALCQPCSQASHCGTGNACVTGFGGEKFCGRAVGSGCPRGYVARTPPGGGSPQCVPWACAGGFDAAGCSCLGPMPGELLINEVLPVPKDASGNLLDVNGDGLKSATQDEYVELLNVTDRTLNLAGLKLYDAEGEVAALGSLRLGPGRSLLVFGGGEMARFKPFPNALVALASPGRGLALNDSGAETVRLHDGRTDIDRVDFTAPSNLREALARSQDGAASPTLALHSQLADSHGGRLSPGAQQCGNPFPAQEFPCASAACSSPDVDKEPNDDRAGASCLVARVTGSLAFKVRPECPGGADSQDWYSFQGMAGKTLVAATHPTESGDIYDTVLKVYGPSGQLLAQGDDCAECEQGDPEEFYSRVQVPLSAGGTYYLVVEMTEYSDCSGGYELEASLQ